MRGLDVRQHSTDRLKRVVLGRFWLTLLRVFLFRLRNLGQ